MPLVTSTAIVSTTDVAAITHEYDLVKPDDAASGATLANAMARATDFIIVDLKARDAIDPAKVANVTDLYLAAAFKTLVIILGSMPQSDHVAKKLDRYEKLYAEQISKYRFETTDTNDTLPLRGEKGLPVFTHQDQAQTFGPRQNVFPSWPSGPIYEDR